MFLHGRHVRQEFVAIQIEDTEDFHVAGFTGAEGIGEVVDPAQHLTRDDRLHGPCTTGIVRNIGQCRAGRLFELQRRNMVPHEKARAGKGEFAGVRFRVSDDISHRVELAVRADNENRRVRAPVCDWLEAVDIIGHAALDRLGNEVRHVVSAERVAVGISLRGQPVPADAAPGTGFVQDGDRHPERILVARSHGHDAGLKICGAAGPVADHHHDGPLGIIVMTLGHSHTGPGHHGQRSSCEYFLHG